MIIQNGYIEFITHEGGGIDSATGYPAETTKEYGELIPCQYIPTRRNNLATNNGEPVTKSSFTILIELVLGVATERLRLSNRCGCVIGEYSVIAMKPLDAVCQFEITV